MRAGGEGAPPIGRWAGAAAESGAGPVVATAGRARGGPAGVADETVMKPGSWAPFVPGKPFKKPLPRAGTKAGGAEG